ncbi:MAG: hypothetical protein PUD22_11195 [Erysipelotrichaceae bacterium]|nr:hypothetical protein [Erysipelotrichaceae bacterium]
MKELLISMASEFGRRHTISQKKRFTSFYKAQLKAIGYTVKELKDNAKKMSNYLLIGDMKYAKTIFLAGYDTSTKSIIPGYKHYPLNNEKNGRMVFLESLARAIVAIGLLLLDLLVIIKLPFIEGNVFLTILADALTIVIVALMMLGIPNNYNYERNTAALTLLYDLAYEVHDNKKCAIALVDNTSDNTMGYRYMESMLKDYRNKNILILDSIAYGEKLYLVYDEKMATEAKKILSYLTDLEVYDLPLKHSDAIKSPLYFYQKSLLLTSGTYNGKEIVVKNVRSSRDSNVDVDRMEKLRDGLARYVNGEKDDEK